MFLSLYTKRFGGLTNNSMFSSINTQTPPAPKYTVSLAFGASASHFIERPDICSKLTRLSGLIQTSPGTHQQVHAHKEPAMDPAL